MTVCFKILFFFFTFSCLSLASVNPNLIYNDASNDSLYKAATEYRLDGMTDDCLKALFEIKCCHVESNYTIAEIYLNDFRNYNISLEYFNQVISFVENDESDKNLFDFNNLYKKSLFMASYIYSNYLGMYSKGYEGYSLFIDKFPDDDLSESVLYEIEQLSSKEEDRLKLILKNKKKES